MEALIVVLVMHCGVPEAIVIDSPVKLSVITVPKDKRDQAIEQYLKAEAAGARVDKVNVEDATGEKCPVST
jgi:hypothetical protein